VAITLLTISILIQDAEGLYGIVRRLLDAVPSGSYLAISHAAGGRKSRAPPRSEEREPVNGLIAKDEADVTIRDPPHIGVAAAFCSRKRSETSSAASDGAMPLCVEGPKRTFRNLMAAL
jgi:hypothetical protein